MERQTLSRRKFLKLAAEGLAGLAAAFLTSGCIPKNSTVAAGLVQQQFEKGTPAPPEDPAAKEIYCRVQQATFEAVALNYQNNPDGEVVRCGTAFLANSQEGPAIYTARHLFEHDFWFTSGQFGLLLRIHHAHLDLLNHIIKYNEMKQVIYEPGDFQEHAPAKDVLKIVLKPERLPELYSEPLNICLREPVEGEQVGFMGYPEVDNSNHHPIDGLDYPRISSTGKLKLALDGIWEVHSDNEAQPTLINKGHSGSPVYLLATGEVIGLVSRFNTEIINDTHLPYARISRVID